MKMSIFAFTLAVVLAAGSAYSEMIAMNDSSRSATSASDVPTAQEDKESGGTRTEADGTAAAKGNQGY